LAVSALADGAADCVLVSGAVAGGVAGCAAAVVAMASRLGAASMNEMVRVIMKTSPKGQLVLEDEMALSRHRLSTCMTARSAISLIGARAPLERVCRLPYGRHA